MVLEARDRVGGRVWNHDLGGGVVSERGGTFVGPTQGRLMALASALGIGTFPTFDDGNDVYVNGSNRITYSDTGPLGTAPPDPTTIAETAAVVAQLDQMATTVPVDAPWEASNAELWEQYTLERWVKENSASPSFQALVPLATRPIFGAEPRELSLLFTLVLHRLLGRRKQPGDVRAQLRHARRSSAVAVHRRLAADRVEDRASSSARGWCCPRRCAGSCRAPVA